MAIDGRTLVIPHLAYPSAHLRTPELFNKRCADLGLNAVVVPWQVAPSDLHAVFNSLRRVDSVAGVIVTIPHKETVAPLCDTLEGAAKALNVANIAKRMPDGTFRGALFDGTGFAVGLTNNGIALTGKRCLLLGAGGAATAIAQAMIDSGVSELAISNRTPDRADRLVSRLKQINPLANVRSSTAAGTGFDLIINATSAGLSGDTSLPIDPETIARGSVVAEVVMQPPMTPLLKAAQRRGAVIHFGLHMLTEQIDQFVAFLLDKNLTTIKHPKNKETMQ